MAATQLTLNRLDSEHTQPVSKAIVRLHGVHKNRLRHCWLSLYPLHKREKAAASYTLIAAFLYSHLQPTHGHPLDHT